MVIERAFRISHNLDIPEPKRKFWPQYAEVVVSHDGIIQDVQLFFSAPSESECVALLKHYRGCVSFPVHAGRIHTRLDEFKEKVADSAELAARLPVNQDSNRRKIFSLRHFWR